MKKVKIKAYAKVNLTLEITGVENGYHTLDSLVASVDLYDLIVLKSRKDNLSSVTMHGQGSESIPPEKNNALKAAELFSQRFHTHGADITVFKNIPIGGGLGGSSADIGGVLNGMAKLYGIEDREALGEIADELGSDARYMLDGGFQRMQGRGTKLEKLEIKTPIFMLLFCPQSSVSAGACYQEYDRLAMQQGGFSTGEKTEKAINAFMQGNLNEGCRYLTNDLYAPASALNEDVKKAFCDAASFAPTGVVMTGSGSAVLAIFENKELCDWAKSRYKGAFKTYVVKTVKDTEK
jgi:4-diphosphocytidyl-2C-methyl-D-erythritol kinase